MSARTNNRVIIDRLQFTYAGILFDFEFTGSPVVVAGDSASGKSLFYYVIDNTNSETDKNSELLKHRKRIKLYNYLSDVDDLVTAIRVSTDKFFIIDNADILVNEEVMEFIRQSTNQFLLFGRNLRLYRAPLRNVAYIRDKGSTKVLSYIED